jgi:hypothetical protein
VILHKGKEGGVLAPVAAKSSNDGCAAVPARGPMPGFDREERAPSLVLAQRRPGQTSFASAYFEHRLIPRDRLFTQLFRQGCRSIDTFILRFYNNTSYN